VHRIRAATWPKKIRAPRLRLDQQSYEADKQRASANCQNLRGCAHQRRRGQTACVVIYPGLRVVCGPTAVQYSMRFDTSCLWARAEFLGFGGAHEAKGQDSIALIGGRTDGLCKPASESRTAMPGPLHRTTVARPWPPRSVSPEVLKPVRRQGRVDRSAGDRPVPEPSLRPNPRDLRIDMDEGGSSIKGRALRFRSAKLSSLCS
jgi:hypothetical protein